MVNYMIRNPEGITVDDIRYEFNQIVGDLSPTTINSMLSAGAILILEPITAPVSNELPDGFAEFSGLTNQ